MSVRMTDEEVASATNLARQWWTPEHVGCRLADEAHRARASEVAKDATIKALADALEAVRKEQPVLPSKTWAGIIEALGIAGRRG